MKRFVEGSDRGQSAFFPETLENFVGEDIAVRVIDTNQRSDFEHRTGACLIYRLARSRKSPAIDAQTFPHSQDPKRTRAVLWANIVHNDLKAFSCSRRANAIA